MVTEFRGMELFNTMLLQAKELKASDVLFTVGSAPAFLRNGIVQDSDEKPLKLGDLTDIFNFLIQEPSEAEEKTSKSSFSNSLLSRFLRDGQLDFPYAIHGVSRYRVNAYKQRGSYAFSVRLIPETIPDIDTLHLPPIVKEFCERNHGLVVITGPTVSGKSTTMASMIDLINKTKRYHVMSLEDPIEYLHTHNLCKIDQREIFVDVASYQLGLFSAMRQFCKVIVLGELRDSEAIRTALAAASKGHLVFVTMHTFDAAEAIEQLISAVGDNDSAITKAQLASVLVGVVAQQLVPHIDGQGLALATEVLVNTPGVQNQIRNFDIVGIRNEIEMGSQYGMRTMKKSLLELEEARIISSEFLNAFEGRSANNCTERLYSGHVMNPTEFSWKEY